MKIFHFYLLISITFLNVHASTDSNNKSNKKENGVPDNQISNNTGSSALTWDLTFIIPIMLILIWKLLIHTSDHENLSLLSNF